MRASERISGALDRSDRPSTAPVAPVSDAWAMACEVKALVGRDQAAARERFGDLMRIEQSRAVRIALAWLRNPADADEAVQDAFIRAFTGIERYQENMPFSHWFTRILMNVCLDRCRSRARSARRLVPLGDGGHYVARESDGPDQRLVARRWRDAVADAVDALPERQRQVFILCQYDDRVPAEVAPMLGLQASTVRVHLFRAVQKLRTALEVWRGAR